MRWNSFLDKIRDRVHELFGPAREQALTVFIEGGNDPIPVINALNGIRMQTQELLRKMDNSWDEKVRDLLYNSGVKDDALDREEEKRGLLRLSLDIEYAMMEAEINNQIAEHVAELAKRDQVKVITCSQCLAPLETPEHTYRAVHVTCKFCQTVNTYEPGTYVRMLGSRLPDIARWRAREEWKNVMENQAATGRQGKNEYRQVMKIYLDKYLGQLKELNPTIDTDHEMELQMRMFDN